MTRYYIEDGLGKVYIATSSQSEATRQKQILEESGVKGLRVVVRRPTLYIYGRRY